MTLRTLCFLFAATWAVGSLTAQDEERVTSDPKGGDGLGTLQNLEEGKGGDLDKEEPVNTGPRGGLRNHMTMVVAMKPRRIAPGAAGTMQVILAMRSNAVLTVGSHLNVVLPDRLGPLTTGGWRLQEASIGRLDTAFKGQPVYDNTAIVEVDVQALPDATYGQHRFSFRVEAEVTDGPSGDSRGLYMDTVNGTVEIGDPLPTPVVVQGAGRATGGSNGPADPGEAAAAGMGASAGPAPDPEDGTDPVGGRVVDPGSAGSVEAAGEAGDSATRRRGGEDEGMPMFLLVGGGVVLLLVGLMVVFRGR